MKIFYCDCTTNLLTTFMTTTTIPNITSTTTNSPTTLVNSTLPAGLVVDSQDAGRDLESRAKPVEWPAPGVVMVDHCHCSKENLLLSTLPSYFTYVAWVNYFIIFVNTVHSFSQRDVMGSSVSNCTVAKKEGLGVALT